MRLLRGAAISLLLIWQAGLAYAQSDQDVLARARQWLGQALKDPEKIKIMECMGVKVYEDPQPAGHPPSTAECEKILQSVQNESSKPTDGPALDFYRSRFLLSGFLLRAGFVCDDAESKRDIDVSAKLLGTQDLQMMSRSYPDTTAQWLDEGAKNFNTQVMKNGLRQTCFYARGVRRNAEQAAK